MIMKTVNKFFRPSKILTLSVLLLLTISNGFSQIEDENSMNVNKPETNTSEDLLWHVKAFRPDAQILKVKAIDKDGNIFDVKGIQTPNSSSSVLNIKALVNGKRLPIKIIVPKKKTKYFPLAAITEDGKLLKLIAINDEGNYLDVKGHSKSGNIIHISAITVNDKGYNIIAISPYGEVNTVVGMKMVDTAKEAMINGVYVYAHVKAIKQE